MSRFLISSSFLAALFGSAVSNASQPYVVSDRIGGNIWRVEDVNGDGDALDANERSLWGAGFTSAQGMATNGRAVFVTEEGLADGSNQIVRLLDLNGDYDALDVGERTIWLDGLDNPRDISFHADGMSYLSEFDNNQIWKLIDLNNDGDVLDVGEKNLFADGINGPQWTLSQGGTLLVSAANGIAPIRRLRDVNGDGDAVDIGEALAITPDYDQLAALLDDGAGGFYFTAKSTNTVFHARDKNGDGDMLDVAEILGYADSVYGLLDGPTGLASFSSNRFLVVNSNHNQLKLVRDVNGDGDGLDFGDVVIFADGFNGPVDVVALLEGLPGDYNADGIVDAADYVVWRKNAGTMNMLQNDPTGGTIGAAQYNTWRTNFGQMAGSGSGAGATSNASIPEPTIVVPLIFAAVGWGLRRRRTA